jgi:glycosyltransferase involved in cell wall biosynthesis
MNILLVTPTPPFPPRDGAQVMMANLARGLSAQHAVTLAALTATSEPPAPQPYFQNAYFFPMRVAPRLRKWAYSFFDALPLWARVHASAELRAALPEIAARENIHVVHLDTGAMAQYADALPHVPTIAAPHDALTPQLQARARHASDWRMRMLMRAQVPKMRNYETRFYPRATRVCVVTDRERDALQSLAPQLRVRVIPNGVDTAYFAPQIEKVLPDSIGFLGAMDYAPNQAAVLYFAKTIFPLIARVLSQVTFTVIGRNPSAEIRALADDPRIHVTGTVDDVRPMVATRCVMVAPIREAGGMKFKVLETLAMGKALVATPAAVEGITARDGTELLLARDANEFANACVKLLREDTRRGALEKNARAWALEHGWENSVAQYEALYQEAINAFAVR